MNFLAGIPNLDARAKTLSCQEIWRRCCAHIDGQGANGTLSWRPPARLRPLRSLPQQRFPTRADSSKGGGSIPPSSIGNRPGGCHKCFTFSSRWVNWTARLWFLAHWKDRALAQDRSQVIQRQSGAVV